MRVASRPRSRSLCLAALSLSLALAACGPEADRDRGSGKGADIGNRDAVVSLHGSKAGRERMYYHTPIDDVATQGHEEGDDDE